MDAELDTDYAEYLVHRRWNELSDTELFLEERQYMAAWWLRAEVENGGLHQYFVNTTGDEALEALSALDALGATREFESLACAIAVFDRAGGYSRARDVRLAQLRSLPDQFDAFAAPERGLSDLDHVVAQALHRVAVLYRNQGWERN